MSLYNNYKHLLGRKYVNGKQDCYGLMMGYYQDVHKITLRNFARPDCFWHHKDFDLINDMVAQDNWKLMGLNIRNLQIGDGLFFGVQSAIPNHLGMYVGNGLMLHHLYGRFSSVENLGPSWTNRLLMIIRHRDIKIHSEKPDLTNLISEHAKRTLRDRIDRGDFGRDRQSPP